MELMNQMELIHLKLSKNKSVYISVFAAILACGYYLYPYFQSNFNILHKKEISLQEREINILTQQIEYLKVQLDEMSKLHDKELLLTRLELEKEKEELLTEKSQFLKFKSESKKELAKRVKNIQLKTNKLTYLKSLESLYFDSLFGTGLISMVGLNEDNIEIHLSFAENEAFCNVENQNVYLDKRKKLIKEIETLQDSSDKLEIFNKVMFDEKFFINNVINPACKMLEGKGKYREIKVNTSIQTALSYIDGSSLFSNKPTRLK